MNPAQTCADITPVELQVCRGLLCSYLPPHPPARATPAPAAQVSPPRQSRGALSACHAAPTHWPKPERGGGGGGKRGGLKHGCSTQGQGFEGSARNVVHSLSRLGGGRLFGGAKLGSGGRRPRQPDLRFPRV